MRKFIKKFIPPIILELNSAGKIPHLKYIENGWSQPHADYDQDLTLQMGIRKYHHLINLKPQHTIGGLVEDHEKITIQYIGLSVAREKTSLRILDFGGSVGFYYHLIKQALPEGFKIEYHIVELPKTCAAGRKINPEVVFHENEIPAGYFDLIIFSGTLQYIREWKGLLQKLPPSEYFYLAKTPMTEGRTFTVRQYIEGVPGNIIFEVRNSEEVKKTFEELSYAMRQELVTSPLLPVIDAPSEVFYANWLYKKNN